MPVTEDNQHGPVYNIHKAENCLIMINVSFGNESRLQQGNMFKTIDKSETGRDDASDKLKGFTEKITQENSSKKYNNISTYKKADIEEIRMRGKDLQEKKDMEETHNFNKCSINAALTSTPHIVTQGQPQTEYLAEDMNISFERALENKESLSLYFCKTLPKNEMVIIDKEKWGDLYSRREIRKNKSISLSTDQSSYFAEKISLVSKYCCICFATHYLARKGKDLLMADFYCKISGCKVSGKRRLHINMELHLEYNINFIKHKKRWEFQGTERRLLQ